MDANSTMECAAQDKGVGMLVTSTQQKDNENTTFLGLTPCLLDEKVFFDTLQCPVRECGHDQGYYPTELKTATET